MAQKPGKGGRPANAAKDPLAVHDAAIHGSQIYLVMSHDDSSGRLEFAGLVLRYTQIDIGRCQVRRGRNNHLEHCDADYWRW